jgi:predicted DNA-binding transcriptional regulator AlpA
MNLKLLYYPDLVGLGYGSRTTIWRKLAENKFPQPVDRDGRPAWKEQDIIDYFESLKPVNVA